MIGASTSQQWTTGSVPPTGERRRSAMVGDPRFAVPTIEQLERDRREAHEAGVREGIDQGLAMARRNADELHTGLTSEVTRVVAQQQAERRALAAGMIDLAIEVATAVVGRTLHDDGAALIERLRTACERSTQVVTTIEVSTADLDAVRTALAGAGVQVNGDSTLGPGEARLSGDWASSSATVASMTEVIRSHLLDAIETTDPVTNIGGAR